MVTHGGIDGYSRMITYLKCSNNNRSSTVYNYFLQAVRLHGLPSRLRCDQGCENRLVAQHMLEHRGTGQGSVISGSSIHNQRIERLWRDLHDSVTKLFYRLFYYLEQMDLLDRNNDMHIYALHYVFIPRVNHALKVFKEGWNNHGIRTAHNQSPNQLFVAGVLQLHRSSLTALDFLDVVDENYRVEENGLTAHEEDEGGVIIPETNFALTNEHMLQLQQQINPLAESRNHGIELYETTVHFITQVIEQNQSLYLQ